jgi:hypothetical protein
MANFFQLDNGNLINLDQTISVTFTGDGVNAHFRMIDGTHHTVASYGSETAEERFGGILASDLVVAPPGYTIIEPNSDEGHVGYWETPVIAFRVSRRYAGDSFPIPVTPNDTDGRLDDWRCLKLPSGRVENPTHIFDNVEQYLAAYVSERRSLGFPVMDGAAI